LVAGAYWYLTGPLVRSVDDPFAEVGSISADVLGTVEHVAVAKNQPFRAGQIVYRLDPSQFQVAFDNAKTNPFG
jgi:membrane fusion protein, multidrug efflux system